ncbi:lectin [Mycena floridula]|nr:lectin [Mycena floridula]
MYQNKPVIVQTSNFGGAQGTPFNDAQDASNFPAVDSGLMIDPQRPIKQMEIRAGWAVDSITTTYRMTDGSTKVIKRGSNPSQGKIITLNDNEIVTAITGFAGNYSYYKQSLLIQMCVLITDMKTGVSRIEGPMGGNNGIADGQFFQVCSPLALAGFENGNSAQIGISGLSIVTSNNAV